MVTSIATKETSRERTNLENGHFILKPRSIKKRWSRQATGVLLFLLLLPGAHLLFAQVLDLHGRSYLVAWIPVLIILFNLFYFLQNAARGQENLLLHFDGDALFIIRGRNILFSGTLSDLKIEMLSWEKESGYSLPVIHFQGPHFHALMMGCSRQVPRLPFPERSATAPQFWLRSEKEWSRLLGALQLDRNTI
ncbi:MAG: hypothetical protein IPJ40_01985 [Saprospirales bacterium]|nr:hypothetical protein [Saprospirales bacterium]